MNNSSLAGGSPETLTRYVGRVRKAIRDAGGDPGALRHDRVARTYTLSIDPSAVDYHRFARLAEAAKASRDPELFDEAAALWNGEPLAGAEGLWAANRRYDLQHEFRLFRHERFQVMIASGRAERAFVELSHLVEADPAEEFLVDGAGALAALGRHHEIPQWIERVTELCERNNGALPLPQTLAEAERLRAPGTAGLAHVTAAADVLTIDDVHVEKKADGHVVLDVRLRNSGPGR